MSRANRRYLRTTILGVIAMGALLWAAMDLFEIPDETLLEFFIASLIVALGVIVLAAAAAGIWVLLRRLFRRGGK
ncbi:hypothetical protein CWI75_07745 [Kineobactrum sediminis]|uniref:Uncharacterized protein n=1 Tax=Kineobactrum sediminis TaxID=1905677 RepID=A0A2N5Y4I3_9GAMM|nr:hypothetical protein [Kineobactrum sediminis]PLW83287.1 hypothetical protein CWI75_07745 [Kineobactrum sediminis]